MRLDGVPNEDEKSVKLKNKSMTSPSVPEKSIIWMGDKTLKSCELVLLNF